MNKVSGYIELTINEEVYPVKFGMGAWHIISKELGKPISEMFTNIDENEFVASLLFGGVNYAHKAGYEGAKPISSLYEAFDLLDNMNSEQLKQLAQTFLESRVMGQTMTDYIKAASEQTEKKKKK